MVVHTDLCGGLFQGQHAGEPDSSSGEKHPSIQTTRIVNADSERATKRNQDTSCPFRVLVRKERVCGMVTAKELIWDSRESSPNEAALASEIWTFVVRFPHVRMQLNKLGRFRESFSAVRRLLSSCFLLVLIPFRTARSHGSHGRSSS